MNETNNINETLAEIFAAINTMNDKITRIFTTLAGDSELLGKGVVHRIDELETSVNELKQFKTKVTAVIITSATIGSIIGSILSTILK